MGTFFVYILKSAVCLVLFYLFYKWLLSRETFHRFNRIALLGILLLSCVLPFVEVTINNDTEVQQTMLTLEQLLLMADRQTVEVQVVQPELTGIQIALFVYLAGILFFIGRHIYALVRMCAMLRKGRMQKMEDGIRLVEHQQAIAPFSWMNYVVISQKDLEENGREIIIHERAHIRNRHSFDLLLVDMCLFFQWFNPAAWLLKQELQNIHEYEADESVIQQGVDAKQYQLLLIKKAVGTRLYSMANSFNHSKLKKRITMMLKEKSSPWARLRYLYVLPLAAIAVTAFARPEVSEKAGEISAVKVNDLTAIVETKLTESIAVDSVKPKKLRFTPPIMVCNEPDEMPQYPGGQKELMAFLASHLKYPVTAQKAGVQGRVVVQYVVESDGKITSPTIVRPVSPELDAEAIRIVKSMPAWIPGKQNGKAVAVNYTIPIVFKLTGQGPISGDSSKDEVVVVGYGANQKDTTPSPLIFVNGKEMPNAALGDIAPSNIKQIDVLKDASSVALYGDKGKDGVILITTFTDEEIAAGLDKKQPADKVGAVVALVANSGNADMDKAVFYIDGKKATREEVAAMQMDPEKIAEVRVVKTDAEGGGDVYLTTKKSKTVSGNEIKATGKVVDKAGQPIVGASVVIEGTTKGTITDPKGGFLLTAPKDATLAVSYIDKATAKVKAASTVQITLQDD